MKLFDVYPLNDITIVKGAGSYIWDELGEQYLDFLRWTCSHFHWS